MWPPSTASDTTAPRPPASGLSPLPVTRLRCIVHVVAIHVLELVGCSADLRGVEALALFRVADVLVLDPRDALPGDGDLPRSHVCLPMLYLPRMTEVAPVAMFQTWIQPPLA
jgi:hypothetical protein